MIRVLKIFFKFVLIFNIINTLLMSIFYFLLDGFMAISFTHALNIPAAIERRSIFSFMFLSFLSYFLMRVFYVRVFKKLNLKPTSYIILFLSIYSQFLSMQYVGYRGHCNYVDQSQRNIDNGLIICEYYSIFEIRKSNCIMEGDECRKIVESRVDAYLFLKCKTDNELSVFKKTILKKYKENDNNGFLVLNGIGPFFNLSVSENNLH